MPEKLDQAVHHPKHYQRTIELYGFEVIDVTETLSFNIGNMVKYLFRAGEKNPETLIQDLEKAHWYGRRALEGRVHLQLDPIDPLGLAAFSERVSLALKRVENPAEGPDLSTPPQDLIALVFLRDTYQTTLSPWPLGPLEQTLFRIDDVLSILKRQPQDVPLSPRTLLRLESDILAGDASGKEWAQAFLASYGDRLQKVDLPAVLSHWFQKALDKAPRVDPREGGGHG